MVFKDISYLELWRPFCSGELNHLCYFGRRHYKEQFFEIILNLDQWFWRCCYLELWRPFCSAERNHLCKFGKGIPEEQFCEIILNLDLWYKRRCCLKDFLSRALAALVFSGAEPFMQFLYRTL